MIHRARALAAATVALVALAAATPPAVRAESAPLPVGDGAAIVNGVPTNLQPTAGAFLFVGPDTKNQFLDCSGVLIGCRTVLTAASCLCKAAPDYAQCVAGLPDLPYVDTSDLRFFLQHSGIHHIREIYIDPKYVSETGHDIAILRLSELVTGVEPARYHQSFLEPVGHGRQGIIAGFGNSGDDRLDEGILRVGQVTTADCPPSTGVYEPANICWTFQEPIEKPGNEANLCLKDEGGPLFIDFGDGPEVAGIHGGGGLTCEADSFSYSTNVLRSRDWIREIGGPDTQRDECSTVIGEVGAPWVSVQGGTGVLPKTGTEASFSFRVPDDALQIRVTVNGDSERQSDYDMFVGLENKIPTDEDYDCAARGVGQFGACTFEEPEVERINVVVRHVRPKVGSGKSRFQVTVTAFQPIPPREDPPRGPDNLRYTKRAPGFRTLTWIDDSNNETGFELQRRQGADAGPPFERRAIIKANRELHLEQVPDEEVFTYRLRAFNGWGVSEWSNLCVVNKPRMRRPGRLRATEVTAGQVVLRWRDNSEGESYMELQRRVSGTTKWRTIKLLPANTITATDKNVQPGENYEYRVRARGYVDECIKHSYFSFPLEVAVPLS